MTSTRTAKEPKRRRTSARRYYTAAVERILQLCYPGQVQAVVVERAVREMAVRDGVLTPKTQQPRRTS